MIARISIRSIIRLISHFQIGLQFKNRKKSEKKKRLCNFSCCSIQHFRIENYVNTLLNIISKFPVFFFQFQMISELRVMVSFQKLKITWNRITSLVLSNGIYFSLQSSKLTQKAFRHVENLFIQGLLFIHPRFVFIVQPIIEPV